MLPPMSKRLPSTSIGRLSRLVHRRQDHPELVAAQPGDGLGLAHRFLEPGVDLAEDDVAVMMAEGVVDLLESIEVEQQQRETPALGARGDRPLQAIVQQGPIGQARQRVVGRLMPQARLGRPPLVDLAPEPPVGLGELGGPLGDPDFHLLVGPAEDLLGPPELGDVEPQLELRDRLPAQDLQRLELGLGQLAGDAIDHAERAQGEPLRRHQRGPGIEPDPGLGRHQRVGLESRVERRVGHDQRPIAEDRAGAERPVDRRPGGVQPHPGLEPLPVVGDETDQRDRGLADQRRQSGEVVEGDLGFGIEDLVAAQLLESRGLVTLRRSSFVHVASSAMRSGSNWRPFRRGRGAITKV